MGLWADRTCQRKSHEGNCQTSLVKLRSAGRRKTAEPAERGGSPDETGTSLTCLLSAGQQRRDCSTLRKAGLSHMSTIFVPVVDQAQRPLMPTTPARARRWIKSAKATPFWKGGLFCVRLNVDPSAREVQPMAVGIDPGSKKEGLVVASAAHTHLNIQADARTGVKEAVTQKSRMRRARRGRKTPCRQPRQNRKRSKKKLPPSTRARWQWKLRLAAWLCRIFPVSVFVVEDIKATTRGKKRWDQSFSPLEVGKAWFYEQLGKLASVLTKQGYQTRDLHEQLGLKKTGKKTAEVWEAHCVDAWTLGGRKRPDNRRLLCLSPLVWHRRQTRNAYFPPACKARGIRRQRVL